MVILKIITVNILVFFSTVLVAQEILYRGSFCFNYSGVKYTARQSDRNTSKSDSKQFLADITMELKPGLRLGVKTGFTLDRVYSSFNGVDNRGENNTQLFFGLNIQKRLVAAFSKKAGLWITVDFSAEPYIQKGSNFTYFLAASSPSDRLILVERLYHDKKNRFSISPSLKIEFPVYKDVRVFASFGYSIDMGKSNRRVFYRGIPNDFTGTYNEDEQFNEGYLFSGVGVSMQIFKPKE